MESMVKNKKILYLLISGMLFTYLILQSTYYLSTDYYFLVATGKEIVDNGIPHTNMWFVDKEIPFIAQQWLYAVYTYFLDKIGMVGVTASIVIIEAMLTGLLYKYINSRLDNKGLSLVCALGCILYHIDYIINIRPEAITLVLLMIQVIATENYIKNKKIYNIVIIVGTAILEANLHGSMSIMHICVMLAYSVPSIYKKLIPNKDFGSTKMEIIVLLLLILSAFAQPYGVEGAMYSIKGLFGGALKVYSSLEMTSIPIGSKFGIQLLVQLIFYVYLLLNKKLNSNEAYLGIGLLILEISAYKHTMFSCIVNAILISAFLKDFKLKIKLDIKLNSVLKAIPYVLCAVIAISNIASAVRKIAQNNITMDVDYYLDAVVEPSNKLEELNIPKDTPIYSTMQHTNYLEYLGYNNLYIDARPEMYYVPSKVTDMTVLEEFLAYTTYGFTYNDDGTVHVLNNDDFEAFLDGYGFKYCLLTADIDIALAKHLVVNTDKWERISSNKDYELWAKKS